MTRDVRAKIIRLKHGKNSPNFNPKLAESIFCKPVFLQIFLFLHETMSCDHSFESAQ